MPTNLWISFQPPYKKASDAQAFNKHQPGIFHSNPSFISDFLNTYTTCPEELHIFCNGPVMTELGHVA